MPVSGGALVVVVVVALGLAAATSKPVEKVDHAIGHSAVVISKTTVHSVKAIGHVFKKL